MNISTSVNPTMSMAKVGHVYILNDKKRGLLKIGRSISPASRLSSLRTIAGIYDYAEFISHKVGDCHRLEMHMHKVFSNRRVAGEWFRCEFEDAVSILKEICPPEFSAGEMHAARAFDQAKVDKIFNAIQAHRRNTTGFSISDAFISAISRLEEIYAFDNSMLHVYGALSDFLPEFSEPHELMVNAKEHLAKSIDLLSKALVGIHSASSGLSIDERETQLSILKGMIDSPIPSDESCMKFEGNGSEWAASQVQEHAA